MAEPRATEPRAPRLRRAWNALVALGVIVGVTLVLLELAFRAYFGLLADERARLIYTGTEAEIAAANRVTLGMPYVNLGGIPGLEGVNARGFRGDPVQHPKPAGTYRVLALGGSTTYGDGVTADEAYPAQLQRVLRETYGYTNVEVVNGGFPSYTSLNSLVNLITRGVEVQPDLVILYNAHNDLIKRWDHPDCFAGDNPLYGFGGDPGYWDNDGQPLSRSVAWRYVQINFGLVPDPSSFDWQFQLSPLCDRSAPTPDFMDRIAVNDATFYRRNLQHTAYIAAGRGLDLLFVTQIHDVDTLTRLTETNDPQGQWASMATGMAEHNAIIREVGADEGVRVYDLVAAWEPNPALWRDYIHLNPDGLRLQAEMIAAYLDTAGVVVADAP